MRSQGQHLGSTEGSRPAPGVPRVGYADDARGVCVPVLDPVRDWLLARGDPVERARVDAVIRDLGMDAKNGRRTLIVGVATVALLVLLAVGGITLDIAIEGKAALDDLLGSLLFTGPAAAAMLVAAVVVPALVARRRRLKSVVEIMLRHGMCPRCAYPLRSVRADPQGITVCPECASAWRLSASSSQIPVEPRR